MTINNDAEIRSRVCPACNAPEGKPCTAPTDDARRPVTWHHHSRIDAMYEARAAARNEKPAPQPGHVATMSAEDFARAAADLDAKISPPRIITWADGFGRWYAAVPLIEGMPFESQGSRIRARAAIRDEIASREQKTGESYNEARARITVPLVEIPQHEQRAGFTVWREVWEEIR